MLTRRSVLPAVWFLYMAGLGVFFPYYSLYLRQTRGLSAVQVGAVLAVLPLVGILAQLAWGRLADRSGAQRRVLAVLAMVAGASFLLLGALRGFAPVLLGSAVLAACHMAVLPLANAVTLSMVGSAGFGPIRMWGTAGFLLAVMSFPSLLGHWQSWPATAALPYRDLGLLFPVVAVLSLAAGLMALALPPAPSTGLRAARGDWWRLLRHPPVRRLLLLVVVAHSFIQGPIYFFPLYLDSRGGDAGTVGRMWILMLLLEIPLIGLSSHTLHRIGARGLLGVGLASEAIRWLTCAATDDLRVVAAVQLLHGVGVAGLFVGAALYLEQAVPEHLRATGQAMVAVAGSGLGAILSNAAAGWTIDRLGIEAPYLAGGLAAAVLLLLLRRLVPLPWRPGELPAAG